MTASIHLTVQDLFTLSNQGQHPRVIVTEPDASVVRGTFVMVSPEPSLTAKALVQLDGQPEGTYNNYQASWIQIDEEGAPTL